MHVEITGVPRLYESLGADYTTEAKINRLVVPFVQALRSAYVDANVSDDESATVDLLTDILVYAAKVEGREVHVLAEEAARSAQGELWDALSGA